MKLSFAQRLVRQSKSKDKIKVSTTSIEKAKPKQSNSKVMNLNKFKQHHNELKNMLKFFQQPGNPELNIIQTSHQLQRQDIQIKYRKKIHSNNLKQNIQQKWKDVASFQDNQIHENHSMLLPKRQPHYRQDKKMMEKSMVFEHQTKKGIPNNGNTCYINALVQCLFHLPNFNQYFNQQKYWIQSKEECKQKNICQIYRNLYSAVIKNSNNHGQISTLPLKRCVSKMSQLFVDWQQEDAHEFMKQLLNNIHEDINRCEKKSQKYLYLQKEYKDYSLSKMASAYWDYYKTRDDSYIYDSFCGQLYNTVECINCQHQSTSFQNFLDLSLPIEGNNINDLLDSFFEPQKLVDFYHCDSCKKSSKKSIKTVNLWKAPNFLIIHLKRSQFCKKNTDPIRFPQNLNLKPYMTESNDRSAKHCNYSLCSVVMHKGVLDAGHYWCNVKQNGKWYQIDDESAVQLNRQETINSYSKKGSINAYILFYSSLHN